MCRVVFSCFPQEGCSGLVGTHMFPLIEERVSYGAIISPSGDKTRKPNAHNKLTTFSLCRKLFVVNLYSKGIHQPTVIQATYHHHKSK